MMKRTRRIIDRCFWSLAALGCTWALAGDLRPGDRLPATGDGLLQSDGRAIDLDRLSGDAGTLIFFSGADCPEARQAYARLESIAEAYRARGFSVVQVGVGSPARGLESLGIPESSFPALFDTNGAIAERFDVSRVPEIFLFDGAGRLAYRGAIDDQTFGPADPELHYLRDALSALESRRKIDVPVTAATGCPVPPAAGDR